MKKQLRNCVTSALLLLPAAVPLAALPGAALAQQATPEIRSLEADADAGWEPGSRLRFRLIATPGVQASVRLRGLRERIPLRETAPGVYVGRYTLKRTDRITDDSEIRAVVRHGNRTVAANYVLSETMRAPVATAPSPRPRAVDNAPPRLSNVTPREGQVMPGGPPTNITGNFEDGEGSGVDPASVRIVVSGRDVTPDARISSNLFSYRAPLPPGRHTVDVTARDRAGNVMRGGWSFEVAVPTPHNLPIQVLNLSPNAHVGPGQTLVQGRTGPNALVEVTVQAVAPIGTVANVPQNLLSQTVQADANGNFAFSFTPPVPVPNTRYDIALVSSRGGVSHENRFSLFQR